MKRALSLLGEPPAFFGQQTHNKDNISASDAGKTEEKQVLHSE